MPFLKGKIAFTPMKVIGRELPDATTIDAKILQHPYRPLEEKEASRISFVNAGSTIPEQFKESFENPIFRDFVVADVLMESRKVDMAIVNARTKFEFEKAMKNFKLHGKPGLGDNKPNKSEIRARVIEEELPNAPIVRRSTQVLFSPDSNMIFIGTSSSATIDTIVPHIKFVVFDYRPDDSGDDDENTSENGEFLIMNALTSTFVNKGERTKITPFCLVDGQEQPPIESAEYMREWMTWLLINSLDTKSANTDRKIQVDRTVRLRYSERSDLEQSQFKARHDNIPIQVASIVAASAGGLVDEVSLYLEEVDVFEMGLVGCELKINKSGYISNIAPPKLKAKEKEDMLPFIMQGVVKIFDEISALEKKFFELRKSLPSWTKEVVNMRIIASQYANDHLDYHISFTGSDPDDVSV